MAWYITLFSDTVDPCYDSPCGRGSCEADELDELDYVCECDDGFMFLNTTCVGKIFWCWYYEWE